MDYVLYIHGKGGSATESVHYQPLFPDCKVVGLDYQGSTPWEAGEEIRAAVLQMKCDSSHITLIANSIGAYFSMNSQADVWIDRAFFISPIVDMEQLICDMMDKANLTETDLRTKGLIRTDFGEELSWDFLHYVREHPLHWEVPTEILYGSCDLLTSYGTVLSFSKRHNAKLTIMDKGEHWFHTEEQMRFLDEWIRRRRDGVS